MKIGIDISLLQGPHRLRGIGSVLINFINNIPDDYKKKHEFIFYTDGDENKAKKNVSKLLKTEGLKYQIIIFGKKPIEHNTKIKKNNKITSSLKRFFLAFPGIRLLVNLKVIFKIFKITVFIYKIRFNRPRLAETDFFIQFDPDGVIPRSTFVVYFIHDIIPYVVEWDYLWNYQTTSNKGYGIFRALNNQINRWMYLKKFALKAKLSNQIFVNSETTKVDVINNLKIKENKIKMIHLGINHYENSNILKKQSIKAYKHTSWGYIKNRETLKLKDPYILYVGGADSRRKIEDLISCFNILRARGERIKLVLVGDTMQGPNNISNDKVRASLLNSSYLKDIIFLGFAKEDELNWLYRNALCFVFPSKYEGFGIPILEAMSYGIQVICYRNDATLEVGQSLPIYVENVLDMEEKIKPLINSAKENKIKIVQKNINYSKNYSWSLTSKNILQTLEEKHEQYIKK